MSLIEFPNLPKTRCSAVLAGGLNRQARETLARLHITILQPSPDRALAPSMQTHADMLFCLCGSGVFWSAKSQLNRLPALSRIGMELLGTAELHGGYPCETLLNIATVGRNVFLNYRTAQKDVIDFFAERHYNIINIRQGYAKCAIAVVGNNAIITEDNGIAAAAKNQDLDVLKIRPGAVRLQGYAYGFIGGTCGKISDNVLAFNGKIQAHPDYLNIRAFCRNHHVYLLSLHQGELNDNGGILPLDEF